MYHNVRDKYGRFSSKKKTTKKTRKTASKPKSTPHILSVFVLDDSVSMSPKVFPTINGFNEVLASGKLDAVKNNVVLHEYLSKFGSPGNNTWQQNVEALTNSSYRPGQGSTALWDAVGFAMKKIEETLPVLPKDTQVLLTIFTDGEENSSRVWNNDLIKNRIQQKQAEGWTITFIGAGDEAEVQAVAQNVGIFATNTMSYANNSAGTQAAFASVARSRSSYTKKVSQGEAVTDGFFAK